MSASGLGRREPCISCGQPVFLAQRLLVDRRLYHRTCFRCARCGAQLTLASCYETEVDGQYCCETCPDEEIDSVDKNFDKIYDENTNIDNLELKDKTLPAFRNTLSDEEKSDNLTKLSQSTENIVKTPTSTSAVSSTAFTGFMSSQLKEMDSDNEDVLPELPKSLPPSKSTVPSDYSIVNNVTNAMNSKNENLSVELYSYKSPDEISLNLSQQVKETCYPEDNLVSGISDNVESLHSVKKTDIIDSKNSVLINSVNVSNAMAKTSESMSMEQIKVKNSSSSKENVHIEDKDTSQHETASVMKDEEESNISISNIENKDVIRNEIIFKDFDESESDVSSAKNESLIKIRMKIFERTDSEIKKPNTQAVSRKSYESKNELNVELSSNIPSNSITDISKDKISNILSSPLDDSASIVNKNSQNESLNTKNDVPYNKSVPFDKISTQFTDNEDNLSISKGPIECLVENTELVEVDIEDDELKHNEVVQNIEKLTDINIVETKNEKVIEDLNVSMSEKNEIIVSEEVQIPSEIENSIPSEVLKKMEVTRTDENKEINKSQMENPSNITIIVDEAESPHKNDENEIKTSTNKFEQDADVEKLDEEKTNYPDHLNPFSDDEESDNEQKLPPDNPKQESLNPFDDSDDEGLGSEIQNTQTESNSRRRSSEKPPRPPLPAVIVNAIKSQTPNVELRKVSSGGFNPFSSDEDEHSDEEKLSSSKPIPTTRQKINDEPTSILSTQSFYGSSSSLTSTVSRRKKAPAPKPPNSLIVPQAAPRQISLNEHSELINSQLSSPSSSLSHISPQVSPRLRKRRPAPRPPTIGSQPTATSTFVETSLNNASFDTSDQNLDNSSDFFTSISEQDDKSILSYSKKVISAADFDNDPDISIPPKDSNDDLKDNTKNIENDEISSRLSSVYMDKSSAGQWKRRKGPAPAIPLLQKRIAGPPIPPAQIRKELQLLEAQQRGLERQGVRLEEIIRERCESGDSVVVTAEPDPETDELVLQLFELVNEKNELFRRQAELMYIRRQQRLEEEHADLEHQIRILMSRPEANKTDSDKAREEQLIQRLLEVVERRDEVITSLEMDRLREKEEDKSIRERMASHRAKREEKSSLSSTDVPEAVSKKDKKKDKRRWLKKDKSKVSEDIKIGVEESEKMTLKKEKKHKKWF